MRWIIPAAITLARNADALGPLFRAHVGMTQRRETDENPWFGRPERRGIKDGKARSSKSGAVRYPYGFASRFEGKLQQPEELIGAAHAACFTMALSLILGEAGLTAERMETTAEVTLDKVSDGFAITVHLTPRRRFPGDDARFRELAARPRRVVRFQAPQGRHHVGRERHALKRVRNRHHHRPSALTTEPAPV
jgi:osmotically inducible protein OsmC